MALANKKVGNKRKVSIREAALALNIAKPTFADGSHSYGSTSDR